MAYYFVIAYLPLVLFVAHFILTALKLTESYNPLQWELVIFIEILVLTIAMTHKYYLVIKENITYQNRIFNQRLKISRDLHDNIGSQLTFIISSIDNLKFLTKKSNESLRNKLTEINSFATNTIFQLRDTIWAMNKNEISFEDLHAQILSFIEKAKSATENIKFNLNVHNTNPYNFSSFQGINLFRTIQEAINNSIKYSSASLISIEISETKNEIVINIIDNGKGFDINTIEFGNGLKNMQNRIQEINGNISIKSNLNTGTTIEIIYFKDSTNAV